VKPILAIEQDERLPGLGLFGRRVAALGAPVHRVRTWQDDLSTLRARDWSAIVPLGGNAHAWQEDEHPFLAHESRLLADALDTDVPVLGVCLGAQVLARVLGGEVRDAGVHESGWQTVYPTAAAADDPLLRHLDRPAGTFQWHGDTFTLPAGAAHLAASDLIPNQAFRAGSAWGIQFHAEVDYPTFAEWIGNHRDACETYGLDEDALHAEVRRGDKADKGWRSRLFDAFIELARSRG
jgi:GMP synthase (glutamine-hydrolysing)